MKRLLVISDTHGATDALDRLLAKEDRLYGVIHLGDYVRDADYIKTKGFTVYSVKGNCDAGIDQVTEQILHIEGKKIWITHGHTYGVKFSLQRLLYRALELEADAVLYGHTHAAANGYEQGILFLNPGSLSEPRYAKPTYALLEIEGKDIKASLKLL